MSGISSILSNSHQINQISKQLRLVVCALWIRTLVFCHVVEVVFLLGPPCMSRNSTHISTTKAGYPGIPRLTISSSFTLALWIIYRTFVSYSKTKR
ncbi:hypothetical protein L211DRAFT_833114 [Terfezia boudieri ATCC MYA-4762]|uniref:Uncharacterized protein n=1 Tax=Terfezia boudieri ATCC MYA-4762 TaxID=1051890 RepID=A0A3N4M2I5_9PEZI|nr:hypothetical protein L211DRAFT_833114 [Terfezia boudieri ATCC MYA-4762]